jgi:general secretion pathway protein M
MNQYIEQALSYWRQLSQREQIMLGSGALALLVTFVYLIIWEPLVTEQERLNTSIAKLQKDVDWLKNAGQEVRKLKAQQGPARQLNGQSLFGVIDSTAKSSGLGESVSRVEPDGTDKVRVWLDSAPFDNMMRWLQRLTGDYGYRIESSVIDKEAVSGRVSVRLVIAGSAGG